MTEKQPSEPIFDLNISPIINQSDCSIRSKSSPDGVAFKHLQENPMRYQIETEATNSEAQATVQASGSGYNVNNASSSSIGVFGCFYCNESFHTEPERLNHREVDHPGKLNYPEPEDFVNRFMPNR